MKILINTASTHKGGGVQVARSFIEECKNFDEHEYYVVLGKMLSDLVDPIEYASNFSFFSIGYRPATRVLSFKSSAVDLNEIEKKFKPDVVFTTSGPAYWRPKAPHVVGYNLPHYIYQDSPYFSQIPHYERLKWEAKGQFLRYFFQRDSDAYVVQTDDVNNRLRKWIGTERVSTVSNTYSEYYDNPKTIPNKLPEKEVNEFRFLTLSAWYPHKNLKIIPEILMELPENLKQDIKFVLTLPEDIFQNKFPSEARDNIINIGPVKPDEGPALYSECDGLFLPTLLECFSASYAEAMKMEIPIITSDLSFARTVCGDAALFIDPMNPFAIAENIIQLVKNLDLRKRLIRNGIKQCKKFVSARERASEYLKICEELVYERQN